MHLLCSVEKYLLSFFIIIIKQQISWFCYPFYVIHVSIMLIFTCSFFLFPHLLFLLMVFLLTLSHVLFIYFDY